MMKNALSELEPEPFWYYFHKISQIPRCTKNETRIRNYIIEIARHNRLEHKVDSTGNLVVKKPAAPGSENQPIVTLQSHLDMVCDKNKDVEHDFSDEPIRIKRQGDWITAEGTTLGSDNGVGVAASLSVLASKNIKHGPMEFLFTVEEETGLIGAMGLADDMLQGRILINMDSEEEGVLCIGCAGGKITKLSLKVEKENVPAGYTGVRLRVGGLRGGHSGLNIHEKRGNAIKLLARFLWEQAAELNIRLASLDGGNKHNAIPRECGAVVYLPAKKIVDLKKVSSVYDRYYKTEQDLSDPKVFVFVDDSGSNKSKKVFTAESQTHLLDILYSMPNGVIAISHAVPGFVQTSTNLGVVRTSGSKISFVTCQRSSLETELLNIADMVCAVGLQAGAKVHGGDSHPPWNLTPSSPLLKTAKRVYKNLFNTEPQLKAIHAGVECGIIGDKFPGMDMISFGPTILGIHSPDERVQVSTVKRFWDFLVGILEEPSV